MRWTSRMVALLLALSVASSVHAQALSSVVGDSITYDQVRRKLETGGAKAVADILSAPPGSPSAGTRILVASPGSGAFAGHVDDLAFYDGVGWTFEDAKEGWLIWISDDDAVRAWTGAAWVVVASSGGGSADVTGPGTSTDNAVVRWDGTDGHHIQNSAATFSDAGAMSWTNSSTSPALSLVQTGVTSTLLSGPAALQLNLDANTGAGLGIVSSAAYAGHAFQLTTTNASASVSAAYMSSAGTRSTLWIEHFGSGSSNGNALLVESANTADSSLGVIGHESARGTAKIRHVDPGGDDHNASVLSLKNDGVTTEAQGIFYDCDSPPGIVGTPDACGKILNLRVQNAEKFVLDSVGNTTQTGEMRSYTARIEPIAGNTISASPSVGGQLLLRGTENDGAMAVLYTDNDATASGDMVSIWADNAAFDRNLMSLTQDGTASGIVVTQNSETASANALQLVSHNDLASTAYVQGEELGLGTLRVHHIYSSGDDHNSAALVLTNAGASSASMGLFMDLVSTGTGALFNIRSGGTERLTLLPAGFMTITSDSTSHGFALDCNGNVSASTSVGGCGWIESTGNSGSALTVYTNHASSTARTVSIRADNVGYAGEVLAVDNDGTNNAVRINQNSNNSGANGLLVSSTNTADSAAEFNSTGLTGQPAVRMQHTGSGSDSGASVLQLNLAGTTAARGLLISTASGVTTAGNLIEARNDTHTPYALGGTGNAVFGGSLTLGNDLGFSGDGYAILRSPSSATAGIPGTDLVLLSGDGLDRTGATNATAAGAVAMIGGEGGSSVNGLAGQGSGAVVRSGAGGATTGSANGGGGGSAELSGGNGGATTGGAEGGTGGTVTVAAGNGGAASTDTPGVGGRAELNAGNGGNAATLDGAEGGEVFVQGGGGGNGTATGRDGGPGGGATVLGGEGGDGTSPASGGNGGRGGDARIDAGDPGVAGTGEGAIAGALGDVFVGDQAAGRIVIAQTAARTYIRSALRIGDDPSLTTFAPSVILDLNVYPGAVRTPSGTVLMPIYTTTQRDAISSPAEGTCLWNGTTHQLECYNGTAWAH